MEDSMSQDHHDEVTNKNANDEILEIKNKKQEPLSNSELNENEDSKIDLINNSLDKSNNKIVENKTLENNKKVALTPKLNSSIDKDNNTENHSCDITKEKTSEDNKSTVAETNLDSTINKSPENIDKVNKEVQKEKNLEESKKVILKAKSTANIDKNNSKEISTSAPVKPKTKPVKEPPIEKKPFLEFVNDYLIPEIKNEFKLKGKEINKIYLQKTHRPIAEDICWVIYCEINDTCNFWLSFEKDDITSLKSFSLCKNYEKPSIIESFLIDEKKITLKLIISRILQRLNGQKLIGAN